MVKESVRRFNAQNPQHHLNPTRLLCETSVAWESQTEIMSKAIHTKNMP